MEKVTFSENFGLSLSSAFNVASSKLRSNDFSKGNWVLELFKGNEKLAWQKFQLNN